MMMEMSQVIYTIGNSWWEAFLKRVGFKFQLPRFLDKKKTKLIFCYHITLFLSKKKFIQNDFFNESARVLNIL